MGLEVKKEELKECFAKFPFDAGIKVVALLRGLSRGVRNCEL